MCFGELASAGEVPAPRLAQSLWTLPPGLPARSESETEMKHFPMKIWLDALGKFVATASHRVDAAAADPWCASHALPQRAAFAHSAKEGPSLPRPLGLTADADDAVVAAATTARAAFAVGFRHAVFAQAMAAQTASSFPVVSRLGAPRAQGPPRYVQSSAVKGHKGSAQQCEKPRQQTWKRPLPAGALKASVGTAPAPDAQTESMTAWAGMACDAERHLDVLQRLDVALGSCVGLSSTSGAQC